jgi:hypothetical protein
MNNTPAEYWDQKTLCALRWITMLTSLPLLSLDSRNEMVKN